MKKIKNLLVGGFLVSAALCACKPQSTGRKEFEYIEERGDITFWSSFGDTYTQALNDIVDEAADEIGFDVDHIQQKSYKDILKAVNNAISDASYPNVIQGYPDHFANYLGSDILTPLNYYFDLYKENNGKDLMDDYYSDYMTENMSLDMYFDGEKDVEAISAVPFNKSTELLGYNGVFVDFCKWWCEQNPNVEVKGAKASTWDLENVPATWQEWEKKGYFYKHIMDILTKDEDTAKVGKLVYGDQDVTGKASNFIVLNSTKDEPAETYQGHNLLLNFKDVNKKSSRIIGWDATDNMFITLLRQWGSEYTELPEDQMQLNPNDRVGKILFLSNKNKQTTIDCLRYFCKLNIDGIFGTPQQFDESYCSGAFEKNQIMFMVCSSGGLSYNTAKWTNRFSVAPLPYYDDGTTVRKYVISQGANLAMSTQINRDTAFDFMVKMSTGIYQAKWCLKSGYYPSSYSATNTTEYQAFLNEAEDHPETAYVDDTPQHNPAGTKVAYREGSILNQVYYLKDGVYNVNDPDNPGQKKNIGGSHFMDGGQPWHKFVDPAFIGSSTIRDKVAYVFKNLFDSVTASNVNKDDEYVAKLMDVCNAFKDNKNVQCVDVTLK